MILKEFDLNKHIESEKAYSREEERKRFSQLSQRLIADSRGDDITKAAIDPEYCLVLYKEYNIE